MFSPGGLGDNGYNDQILRGVQRVSLAYPEVAFSFLSPNSVAEAEIRFKAWLTEKDNGRSLFVLAGSEYEDLVTRYSNEAASLSGNKSLLLFETANAKDLPASTFLLSMYGASYLAGKSVAYMGCTAPLAIVANSNDLPIRRAVDGFKEGYEKEVDVEYLSDDWMGYTKADELYGRMDGYARSYDYFWGLAGGANLGIYRYLREYPGGRVWTAGMDVDQSALTNKMTGSVVKHIDRLIQVYLDDWIVGKELAKRQVFGLGSGYVDWLVAPDYEAFLGNFVEENRSEAIRKEAEYEGE